jgi:hypothetical protein
LNAPNAPRDLQITLDPALCTLERNSRAKKKRLGFSAEALFG